MNNEVKNEPAFPVESRRGDIYSGMDLRDYFAAKAMQGLCAPAFNFMKGEGHATDAAMSMMKDIGAVSYQIADAMLAQRAKGE